MVWAGHNNSIGIVEVIWGVVLYYWGVNAIITNEEEEGYSVSELIDHNAVSRAAMAWPGSAKLTHTTKTTLLKHLYLWTNQKLDCFDCL